MPGAKFGVQAQHNVVVDRAHFPSAQNLRHVLVAQADLSKHAARIAAADEPSLARRFERRAEHYRDLTIAARTLGGQVGAGSFAALESANAARRIEAGPATTEPAADSLRRLAHLDDRVDARISAAVEHGLREKLYFVAINLPTMGRRGPDGIYRAAEKYIVVDSPGQSDLLTLVRERLRPAPPVTTAPRPRSIESRAAYEMVLGFETPATTRRSPRL